MRLGSRGGAGRNQEGRRGSAGSRLRTDPPDPATRGPAVGGAQPGGGRGGLVLLEHPPGFRPGRPTPAAGARWAWCRSAIRRGGGPLGRGRRRGWPRQGVQFGLLGDHVERRAEDGTEFRGPAEPGWRRDADGPGRPEVDDPGHGGALVGLDREVGPPQVAVDASPRVGVLARGGRILVDGAGRRPCSISRDFRHHAPGAISGAVAGSGARCLNRRRIWGLARVRRGGSAVIVGPHRSGIAWCRQADRDWSYGLRRATHRDGREVGRLYLDFADLYLCSAAAVAWGGGGGPAPHEHRARMDPP